MKKPAVLCVLLLWALAAHAVTLDSDFDGGNAIADGLLEYPAGTVNVYTDRDSSGSVDGVDGNRLTDWFYFQLSDVQGSSWTIRVDFCHYASSSYWSGNHGNIRPVWSYDGITWNRLAAIDSYADGLLTFTLPVMAQNTVYVAMDIPYTYTDLMADVSLWDASPHCTAEALSYGGQTGSQGGRHIYHLHIEEPGYYTDRLHLVLTARSHPGEPQASHHLKGMVDWILSSDPAAVDFRRRSTIDVFPMVNPDGVFHGRIRAYDDGHDANRRFDPVSGPSLVTESPETFLIHSKIHELSAGTDYAIDLHSSNWSYPAITEDQTTAGMTTWSSADKSAILANLSALDTGAYWHDSIVNYDTSYTSTWRHGQPYQYGYQTLISEGGIYTDSGGVYPTAEKRQTGGAHFLRAFIDALDGGVVELVPDTEAELGIWRNTGSSLWKNTGTAAWVPSPAEAEQPPVVTPALGIWRNTGSSLWRNTATALWIPSPAEAAATPNTAGYMHHLQQVWRQQ